jgi:phospholipase B1
MTNNDPSTIKNLKECSCHADADHKSMDDLAASYNQQLITIANKYKAQPGGTFAVVYHPANINIMSFPIDALSNYDCFHPSQKGHQWMAKVNLTMEKKGYDLY